METPKNLTPHENDGDETLLSFDRSAPPAPVDVHAFTRRAGEIISRAAKALLGRR
jgi:hypothetical protein